MPGLGDWVSESWGSWDNLIGTKGKSGRAAAMRWCELDKLRGSSRRPCGWVGLGKSGPAVPPTPPLCTLSSISGPLATWSPPSSEGEVTAELTFPSAVAWISAPGECIWKEGRKSSTWGLSDSHVSVESVEQACRLSQSPQLRAPWRVRGPGRGHWARRAPQCNMKNYDDVCTGIHMQECVCVCVRYIHIYPHEEGQGGRDRRRRREAEKQHNTSVP